MKVLILTNSFSGGGAEKAMSTLHSEFLELGINSKLCALMLGDKPEQIKEGIQLSRKWKSGIFSTLNNFLQYYKVLGEFKPSYIIANCELSEMYIALTPQRLAKVVVVEHTTFPWRGRRFLGVVVRLILRVRPVSWATVSKSSELIWPIRQKATYIANPIVATKEFNPNSVKIPCTGLVCIGRLVSSKRTDWVLRLGKELNVRVLVVGDGILRNQLQEEFPEADFLGFQDNPWSFLDYGQLLIVPSDFEGDGLVVAEAILQRIPVLLRKTKDFESFNLPEMNYFSDEQQLREITMNAYESGLESYIPSESLKSRLFEERDPKKVAMRWVNFLETMGSKWT